MGLKTFSTITVFCLAGFGSLQLNAQPSLRPRIRQAVDESRRVALKGHIHVLAQARFDRGAAPADLPMERMLLVLKRSDEQQEELDGLLEEQHDPSSANYQQWLTPEEFGRRFGPSEEDVQTVNSWLMSHGFQVEEVAKSRMVIEFSGTADRLRETFHAEIHKFEVNGVEHWATRTEPEIPEALAPVVEGFASLNDFHSAPQLATVDGQASADRLTSPLTNMANGNHWLSPADYATIYNINPAYAAGINGAGATIAVVGRSNIDAQDIADFRKYFGLANNPPQVIVNGPDPGIVKGVEQMEATLDVTWAGAVAPGATVKFVVSKSTSASDGVYLSAKYIVDHNLADVMTESFGGCEATFSSSAAMVNTLAQQAAAQGITFLVSTGDSGSAGCDPASAAKASKAVGVNYLASTPYTVAVGGSQFNDTANASQYWAGQNGSNLGSALSYIAETVWNESCEASQSGCTPNILAGGGGASTLYGKPSWQAGVPGIPKDGKRDLPDVSLTAAVHDPYILCLGGSCRASSPTFNMTGGTSAAAPALAGIMALVRQKTGARQGQANTVLYALAAKQAYSQCNGSSTSGAPAGTCVFNDITTGTNAVPGQSGYGTASATYAAATGYDLATGLGSVNVFNLLNQWTTAKYAPTTVSLKASPTTITPGGSTTVSITVTPRSGSGKPTGTVALMAGSTKIADLTLSAGSAVVNVEKWQTGTYALKAQYAGDGTYAPSDSPSVTVTVGEQQSSQPAISFVSPGQVKAGQAVTLIVNGTNFQSGLTAYIFVDGEYYPMKASLTGTTKVRIGVTMGGPGAYETYVVIQNPGGLYTAAKFEVTN